MIRRAALGRVAESLAYARELPDLGIDRVGTLGQELPVHPGAAVPHQHPPDLIE